MVGANLGPDYDLAKRLSDLELAVRGLSTRDVLQNASIGAGGLTVNGGNINITSGGSLIVTGTGTIQLNTGTFVANVLQSLTDAHLGGFLFTPAGRAFQVVTGFASAWLDSTGKLGINTSTIRDKQDFEPAATAEIVDALLRLGLIRFRRTALVEEVGDDAPYELGTAAEYMAGTPLREWVFTDAEGEVQGIEWAHLVIPLIATVQALDARLRAAGL